MAFTGKNAKGRKISGIEPMPGKDKILVTSNDSRVRLYDLTDHSLSCKFKGATNTSSQIKATFSRDGQSIVCGSEVFFLPLSLYIHTYTSIYLYYTSIYVIYQPLKPMVECSRFLMN